jgi:hypothetical protein
MRKKPMHNGGYNNQHKKPRFQHGGSGGHHQHGGHNRPRKNYSASREKYLAQARDALASGDRVMAEYFYQHADHCYRMMVEEGYRPRDQFTPAQPGDVIPQEAIQEITQEAIQQEPIIPGNTSQLPAFITANYEDRTAKPVDPATIQNWEERDA